jgi:outer membrane protein OmpA-like peptidoglycan-associated protein
MKRVIILLVVLIGAGFSARAQYADGKIDVSGARVIRVGDQVVVTFSASTSRFAVKSNEAVGLQPVITDGEYRVSLAAAVVEGRRAAISRERYEWETGKSTDVSPEMIFLPGDTFQYRAATDFQPWMEGAGLTLETLAWGCNLSQSYQPQMLASNVLPTQQKVEPQPVPVAVAPKATTGDTLARSFPFVLRGTGQVSEDDINNNREHALIVYYRVNRNDIEENFSSNRQVLNNLLAAVRTIMGSNDSRVSRIIVAGFASPEGPLDRNERLAWNRAVSVRDYVAQNTGIDEGLIAMYNGAEDWYGLRLYVEESNLYDKARILQIIDTVPALSPDGRRKPRLEQLQALDGGRTYRYLLDNYFPKLRNGAFIQVYYDDK